MHGSRAPNQLPSATQPCGCLRGTHRAPNGTLFIAFKTGKREGTKVSPLHGRRFSPLTSIIRLEDGNNLVIHHLPDHDGFPLHIVAPRKHFAPGSIMEAIG